MNLEERRDRILVGTLGQVPFDGWTERALRSGAVAAGFVAEDGPRAFPAGMLEVVEHFCDYGDRRMIAALEACNLADTSIRDRVATAVRCRLEAVAEHREGVRRALAFMALPGRGGAAARCTYRTVNAIWYAVGDRSTDFNFYTKRGFLAAIYGATVLYWLNDTSEGSADTWAFLDRRISGLLSFGRMRSRVAAGIGGIVEQTAGLARRRFPFSQ